MGGDEYDFSQVDVQESLADIAAKIKETDSTDTSIKVLKASWFRTTCPT